MNASKGEVISWDTLILVMAGFAAFTAIALAFDFVMVMLS